MRKVLAAAAVALLSGEAALADSAADAARVELARERRRLSSDVARLAEASRRLEVSLSKLAEASREVSETGGRPEVGAEELVRREDALASVEQQVKALLERRRLLADRLIERRRTIAFLESEVSGRGRAVDLLSGRFTVVVDPGEQRGVFRLSLAGTIVSGEYTLEGGYSGSFRGTLIGDRLRLERVDSTLGFSTIYYGRLTGDGSSIAGTWESTTFGLGAPGSGRWRAVREEEREETP